MKRLVLIGLLVLPGCVTTAGNALAPRTLEWDALPTGASPTGWWRYETPRFELFTDLSPERGTEAVASVTRELLALSAIMGQASIRARTSIQVIVLSDGLEFERYFGRKVSGLVSRRPEDAVVVLYGDPDRWQTRASLKVETSSSLVTHELAHVVLGQYLPIEPRWFAEGMAEFLETYAWVEGGAIEIGRENLFAYRQYRANRTVGLENVAAWGNATREEGEAEGFARYGYCWALIHYLVNQEPERFAAILDTLGKATSNVDTLQQLLPGVAAGDLDKRVFGYMKTGEYSLFRLEVPRNLERAAQRPANDLEVLDVRVQLERLSGQMKK